MSRLDLCELGAGPGREATPEHAREFRQALEELGTTFVKLGQILSSRPDLLPDVYIAELGGLVDDVPPVPFEELRPVIEGEVGPGVFAEIGEEPLAAASIAQIHPALLANGRAYHADPHRGNVFLTDDGRLARLDFGLIGRLADDVRRRLALLLLALAQNRADDVADVLVSLSLVQAEADQAGFAHDVRRKLPRYHWRPLGGIEAGQALADLQRLALRHRILLPTSFALVGKTLAQADAIARTLDPGLDPVELIEEDTLDVVLSEVGRGLEPNRLLAGLFMQLEPLARVPRQVGQIARKLDTGTLKVGIAPKELDGLDRVLRSTANRIGAALIVVGLLVSSALMARVNEAVALAGFATSAALALYLVWRILRTLRRCERGCTTACRWTSGVSTRRRPILAFSPEPRPESASLLRLVRRTRRELTHSSKS
jgi:predicted unusual protein kinase regulating ubiquinone biosynthesis (AarF/ABC1/UbiB family)